MIAILIYSLCTAAAFVCALLLLLAYRRNGYRLLWWSSLCFFGLTLNNALLIADKIIFPDVDLLSLRSITALLALMILLYGLIWDQS